ncbi:hypothetical protein [uncultured Dietzia sp.]|uniref:hypothetical protein n=1 Tax=uncultured Dietzia sp. TaxID=395519 RepID=UPI0025D4DC85|nr:hypothetical protein [uncultured Dietzia sp.]
MTEWSTVLAAMRRGRRRPVRGRVTAHKNSNIQFGYPGGVPFMPLFLHPDGLDLARVEGSLRMNRPDGAPHFLIADGRAWDFSENPDRPVTTESRYAPMIGPGFELISASENADEALSRSFPSGPVRSDKHLGRSTWVVPGSIADVDAEIVVDQRSGVVLAVTALDGDWSAQFTSIEFPESIDPETFRWGGESTQATPMEILEREDGTWTAEDAAISEPESGLESETEPEAPRGGGRVLPVRMETWLIEDGSVSPPRVGETVEWVLAFTPDNDDDDATTDLASTSLVAEATPAEGRPPGKDWEGTLRWSTHLQGDGWSATWDADRPVVGSVCVRGRLWIDSLGQAAFPARQTETRGRISRVRVEVARQRKVRSLLGHKWEAILDSRRWIDVEVSPHAFDMPGFAKVQPDGTREYPVNVVVELDLDAAAPPEPRPHVVPGRAVAHGQTLWVTDRQLPVVVRIDLDTGATTETVLPLPVATHGTFSSGQLSVRADDTGCWVLAGDSRYRLNRESAEVEPDPEPLGKWSACAYDGRTMLVLGQSSVLIDQAGHRRPIELPEWDSGSIVAHRRAEDPHFVVALRVPDVPMRPSSFGGFRARYVYRLARIDDDVVVGPEVEFTDQISAIGIVDGRIWVVAAGAVHTVNDDLTLDTVHRLPTGMVLEAGFVGDRMWILTHHPDGTGRSGFWPHRVKSERLSREDGFWLFTLLELPSLEPVGVMGVDSNYLHVTADADGTVWVPGPQIRGLRTDGTVAQIDVTHILADSGGERG